MESPVIVGTEPRDWEKESLFSSVKSAPSLAESEKQFLSTGEDFQMISEDMFSEMSSSLGAGSRVDSVFSSLAPDEGEKEENKNDEHYAEVNSQIINFLSTQKEDQAAQDAVNT